MIKRRGPRTEPSQKQVWREEKLLSHFTRKGGSKRLFVDRCSVRRDFTTRSMILDITDRFEIAR